MRHFASQVPSAVLASVLALSATVLLAWPSAVCAVGAEEKATEEQAELAEKQSAPQNSALAQNESKVGDLVVTATLIEGDGKKSLRQVHLECQNPTDSAITGKVELALTRTRGSGMERVMPTPQVAWRRQESVTVQPGETLTRDIALPKNIAGEVARVEKAREAALAKGEMPMPRVFFGVAAMAFDSQTNRAAQIRELTSNKLSGIDMPMAPRLASGSRRNLDLGY